MPTVATASEDGVSKVWDIQQSDISRCITWEEHNEV